MSAKIPKVGDRIAVEKFWISKMNMRAGEKFGESEADQTLIGHVIRTRIEQPFTARPEGDGFGVVIGGRRFQAMVAAGFKEFVVGEHVLIREMTDQEARAASLKENLELFRSSPDPITRAEAIAAYSARMTGPGGVRRLAAAWNMPASTLSDYLKILELSPEMQDVVRKGLITFYDGIEVVREGLGSIAQEKLAALARESKEAFRKEFDRVKVGKGKRGIPRGKFVISRIMFDKRYKSDMELYGKLSELAKEKDQKIDEFCKNILRDYVEELT